MNKKRQGPVFKKTCHWYPPLKVISDSRILSSFFKKGPIPASFLFIFGLFKQYSTTKQCEKMPSPSSIRRQDSNSWPLELESSPITTRPSLKPVLASFWFDYRLHMSSSLPKCFEKKTCNASHSTLKRLSSQPSIHCLYLSAWQHMWPDVEIKISQFYPCFAQKTYC